MTDAPVAKVNSRVTKRARDWVRTATAKLPWIDWMVRNVMFVAGGEKKAFILSQEDIPVAKLPRYYEISVLISN